MILGAILLLGAARAALYFIYAYNALPFPFETYHLEAKMVLLAERVQMGESLYPEWGEYPHVANFFGPAYFAAVGLLGRAAGADLDQLFTIGRGIAFGSASLTTLGVGVLLHRRYGGGPALAGVALSLGSLPMFGFSVMVRPDLSAEMLGFGGVLLSGHRTRLGSFAGCVLLVLAILTKQTAAIFLVAAALGLELEGRRQRAMVVLGGCTAALGLTIAAINVTLEPNLVRSLLGEAKTPWSFGTWLRMFRRIVERSPDLLVFAAIGLGLWSGGRWRDPRLFALGLVVLAASLGTSGKRGADANYYVSLRVVEGLTVGTLWHAARTATTRRGRSALVLASALGLAALVPSTLAAAVQAMASRDSSALLAGSAGRILLRTYHRVFRAAENPRVRLLTDSGLIDLHQNGRAAFGDPFLFRLLVTTGQIRPTKMRDWIDAEAYDLVVTTDDLFSDRYSKYEFGLPMVLVERLRVHYKHTGTEAALFFYRPRRIGSEPTEVPERAGEHARSKREPIDLD